MNKIKKLFASILSVAVLSGAATTMNLQAQTSGGRVLVSSGGKQLRQSDIDKTIEFFEWMFETKLTQAQRRRIQSLTENEFRRAPAASRKSIDETLADLAKLNAASEADQRRVRADFLPSFVAELRKHPKDESSKLLFEIYENAQNDNTSVNSSGNANNTDASSSTDNGGDFSAIVGKWVQGQTGGSSYNVNTGALLGTTGSHFEYQFHTNGTFEFTGLMNVMRGGCSQQVFNSAKGTASLSGDVLTINWGLKKVVRDFSCDRANNYTRTLPLETEKHKITFRNKAGQTLLCLSDNDCFRRRQ